MPPTTPNFVFRLRRTGAQDPAWCLCDSSEAIDDESVLALAIPQIPDGPILTEYSLIGRAPDAAAKITLRGNGRTLSGHLRGQKITFDVPPQLLPGDFRASPAVFEQYGLSSRQQFTPLVPSDLTQIATVRRSGIALIGVTENFGPHVAEQHAQWRRAITYGAAQPRYSDEELAAIVASQESDTDLAFDELYNRYYKPLIRLLCLWDEMKFRNAAAIIDGLFRAFLQYPERFNPDKCSFKVWLYRAALEKASTSCRCTLLKTTPIGTRDLQRVLLGPLDLTNEQQLIATALARLASDDQQFLRLHYVEGYSINQIATILGMPVIDIIRRSVRSRVRLGKQYRALIRELLPDYVPDQQSHRRADVRYQHPTTMVGLAVDNS